jgi:hypothetical protein
VQPSSTQNGLADGRAGISHRCRDGGPWQRLLPRVYVLHSDAGQGPEPPMPAGTAVLALLRHRSVPHPVPDLPHGPLRAIEAPLC